MKDFEEGYSALAVADGIAAFCTRRNLALVDLGKLTALTESRRRGRNLAYGAFASSLRYYRSPMWHGLRVGFLGSLVLTSTHLAVLCGYREAEPTDSEDDGVIQVDSSHNLRMINFAILSIDFGTMRCRMVDKSRQWQVEEKRKRKRADTGS
ncbi:unnamed protein product [Sympodiomycopsis kandeliae]